jgi:hypothetical protein
MLYDPVFLPPEFFERKVRIPFFRVSEIENLKTILIRMGTCLAIYPSGTAICWLPLTISTKFEIYIGLMSDRRTMLWGILFA